MSSGRVTMRPLTSDAALDRSDVTRIIAKAKLEGALENIAGLEGAESFGLVISKLMSARDSNTFDGNYISVKDRSFLEAVKGLPALAAEWRGAQHHAAAALAEGAYKEIEQIIHTPCLPDIRTENVRKR